MVLTRKPIALTGTDPDLQPADAAGDLFSANQSGYLLVKNDDTVVHTVSINSFVQAKPGLAPADVAVVVPANDIRLIGPFSFSTAEFRNPDGNVEVSYDAVTGVTVGYFG